MSDARKLPSEETIPWLRRLLGTQLAMDPDAIDADERLSRYGLNSLAAATAATAIGAALGRTLAPTLVWDHPTLRRLAAYLDGAEDEATRPPPMPLAVDDAIAIIGLGCRLPGAASATMFWELLCAGGDAITEVPAQRWAISALYDPDPQMPGRMASRWGGFIDNVDGFDADFFGLSPRETAQADPQQRLALELAWEALEDAGIRPSRLGGSRTGVFMGAMWSDYARLLTDRAAIAQHTATGQDTSIVSARIAYALGLEGPALTVNTACSSALVAVHQACRSLRAGESTLALAGGVHLVLAPESGIAMTKFGAMAPDGRCKAFDAGADGYVRGEGGGIVVLKPLSRALADCDRIYAVIRGGAVNNDGASNGLTAPNPSAQRAMLRDALYDAVIAPAAVDYVEAHGTGTALGDPIEANALGAVLCRERPAGEPLRIGSVKTNIGHLEAAAGAAGLIKLALALHHRWIPPSLHFRSPNPAIDFAGGKLAVQAKGEPWPTRRERLVGGVSSFGFGGTNCHLLLEAAPAPPPVTRGRVEAPLVFVFAGNGGNWPGMADALLAVPQFAASLRQSDSVLAALGYPASVIEVLADRRVEDVALGQPALCAFQLALCDLLASLGVRPTAVIGHSVGEAAAAAIAGILPREQALRLVVARSRLQARVAGKGAMALAAAPASALAAHLPQGVVVAGENGPRATLLAGSPEAVALACQTLDKAGIVSQRVNVPVAYHSPQMDPLRPLLEAELAELVPEAGDVSMVSTVTGALIVGSTLDAAYWGRNLREPVRFRQGAGALIDAGHRSFVEIAPHPLFAAQIVQMMPGALVVSPLRRGAADIAAIETALAPLGGDQWRGRRRHLLLLSARSPAALDALAQRWAARLPDDWPELCHTALAGRERFAWRLAVSAADGEEARQRLLSGAVLRGKATADRAQGLDPRRASGESWEDYLDRCATAFVAGAEIDGTVFDQGEKRRIVSAPTYPFERHRYWLTPGGDGLSYALEWQPFSLPPAEFVPTPAPAAPPPDPGLEVEATAFARAALAAVPPPAVVARHRQLVERIRRWAPLDGPAAADGPAATLLRRVGAALPGILRGQADPVETLFPDGRLDLLAAAYDAPPFAPAQDALAEAIGAIGRPLRVFELGAGTGALTGRLLAALPAGSDLVSTDVSAVFLAALRRRFAGSPSLRTALFDIDHPAAQDGPFDAIVAANVVHAGSDLAAILAALRARLAPGGVLGLVELVRAPRWIELVFGITEGWWRFRGDPRRAEAALLDVAGWTRVLAEAGFADRQITEDRDAHAVILARAPADVGRVYRPAGDAAPARLVEELEAEIAAGGKLSVVADAGIAGAAAIGAAQALSLGHPQAFAASFELADRSEASLAAVSAALGCTGGEDQLRVTDGALSVARVVRAPPSAPIPTLAADRLYIVAGGLGRLGHACARFLIERGARRLLLLGRSPPDTTRLGALHDHGAAADYLRLDLTTADASARLAAEIDRKLSACKLGGVVHAAGLLDGATAEVIAAKLASASVLEQAVAGYDPEFLLLFSSAAGVWGARGHVAYSAANRALDCWAQEARARGVPATAIGFGRFAERGLLPEEEDAALAASGLLAMAPGDAFAAALQAVADGVAHRIVAAVDWPVFRASYQARRRCPMFDQVAPAPAPQRPHIRAVPAGRDRVALDRAGLAVLVAELTGHDSPERIDPDRGFFEQGLDSLMAVELRRRLEDAAGVPVPAAVLFAHPTVARLADWLAGNASKVPGAAPQARPAHQKIAIVGLGCRFPGGVASPDQFRALLFAGREAIGEFPPDRPTAKLWDMAAASLASRRGGFLDRIAEFDAAFFGLSPREAAQIDPQQRLLLEVAWEALEHAGIAPDRLAGSRTGVFVGATGSDYAALARAAGTGQLDAHSLVGQPSNALAGRIAYQLGLHGPALTIDTACSSSLVALHLAVAALRRGEAELALAGGVNLMLTPDTSVILSRAGLLSPEGRCKVFDAAADGYVRGEAVAVAVLKPLAAAERDGDPVLAVIRGSAVNHDGRSSSFTSPNGAAQAAVIRDALTDAGCAPDDIDYVEAHGTGTALGDPIELDALSEVFAGRATPLPVGSVKAAIGHTEAAAGLAGISKAVLTLAAGMAPPQVNFSRLNPHARRNGPTEIAASARQLGSGVCRIGVSAFGASGTNAHVVLETGKAAVEERGEGPARLVLSAATPRALDELRQRVVAELSEGRIEFADLCHTAWIGRARLGFWLLAENTAELATAPIETGPPPALELPRGRRVPFPLTPFDRSPYWVDETAPARRPASSLLGEARRSARSGEEIREGRLDASAPWLRDHVIDGTVLLPAAGFVSMALGAGLGPLAEVEYRRSLEVAGDGIAVQLVRDHDNRLALYAETAEGWAELAAARITPAVSIAAFAERPAAGAEAVDGGDFAAELATRGFEFGPIYRVLSRLERDGTMAEGRIGSIADANAGFDPMLLDAAFQTLTALLPRTGVPWLPARVARVTADAEPRGSLVARALLRHCDEDRAIGDAVLERADGCCVVLFQGIELRPMRTGPGAWFHDVVWRPAASGGRSPAGPWHAIGPGAAALGTASCDEAGDGPLSAAHGIVDLRPLAAATPEDCIAETAALVRRAAALEPPPQLVLVSRGASTAPPVLDGAPPAAAVLMGMQGVIAAEHPELRCRWLDLDPDDPAMPTAFAGAAGRYALRQGRLLAPEIAKAIEPPPGLVRLAPGPEHSFADLSLAPDPETPPRPGEVRIAVAAAGVNFKDVLSVLGRAPGRDQPLGLECAGEVVTVGAGVEDFAPGDPVMAFAPGALASRVNVAAGQVLRRPDWLDVDAAASLPVAALTAWHGLRDVAAVGPGMRVLVHAGAGGVGAMAVGLARLCGARVFATASEGKEHAARAAGAEMVGDSRSTDFAATASDWAGTGGFDVVLNALGPEIAAASAALLRPGGVFLEIGNAPPQATVQPTRHVAYDLTMPMAADPRWFRNRMARILELVRDRRLPLPRRAVLPLARAEDGLRALGQGATIGKLVLRFPQPLRLRRDGTYLVAGGTGAVGREIARWLAAAGAGRVVLTARHAPADSEFETVAVDVADAAAMAGLLRRLPGLRGVIHAAGVVRDRTLAALHRSDIAEVAAAKIAGAAHLDALTRDRPLDLFVLVSSTAGSIAAPGQAAYAGVNAWLDRLAASRRAAGLPAVAIGSGPWRAGMFARLDPALRHRLQADGFRAMAPHRAAAAFARTIEGGAVHRLVMDRAPAAPLESAPDGEIRAALFGASPGERAQLLRDELARRLAALLGLAASQRLDPQRSLRDLGLDSLLAVSLRNELAAALGVDLPSTLLFDYPTLEALATHLLGSLDGPETPLDILGERELAALLDRELGTAS